MMNSRAAECIQYICDYPGCREAARFFRDNTFSSAGDDVSKWIFIPDEELLEGVHADGPYWVFCPEHPGIRTQIDLIRMVLDANRDS